MATLIFVLDQMGQRCSTCFYFTWISHWDDAVSISCVTELGTTEKQRQAICVGKNNLESHETLMGKGLLFIDKVTTISRCSKCCRSDFQPKEHNTTTFSCNTNTEITDSDHSDWDHGNYAGHKIAVVAKALANTIAGHKRAEFAVTVLVVVIAYAEEVLIKHLEQDFVVK